MYIDQIRHRLEMRHPRLCRLLNLTVAILLYADDAALPADTAEDLQLSTEIFVQFCNEMHLFVSTSKTVVMVFHAPSDTGVEYRNEAVFVDGHELILEIYGERIKAVSEFKYLGVLLSASGDEGAHTSARICSLEKAGNMLLGSLPRLPGYTH
eukprot:5168645-Karenia_brevis.AAC.1